MTSVDTRVAEAEAATGNPWLESVSSSGAGAGTGAVASGAVVRRQRRFEGGGFSLVLDGVVVDRDRVLGAVEMGPGVVRVAGVAVDEDDTGRAVGGRLSSIVAMDTEECIGRKCGSGLSVIWDGRPPWVINIAE